MQPPQRKDKSFLELQAKWYNKLRKEGFEDIEQSEDVLKVWHSFSFPLSYNQVVVEGKQEYYRLAGQFVHEGDFKSKLEQVIWVRHSEGMSIRDITKAAIHLGYKTNRDAINKKLNKLIKEMFKFYRETEETST